MQIGEEVAESLAAERFFDRTAIGWFTEQDTLVRGLPNLKPYGTTRNSEGWVAPAGAERESPSKHFGSRHGL